MEEGYWLLQVAGGLAPPPAESVGEKGGVAMLHPPFGAVIRERMSLPDENPGEGSGGARPDWRTRRLAPPPLCFGEDTLNLIYYYNCKTLYRLVSSTLQLKRGWKSSVGKREHCGSYLSSFCTGSRDSRKYICICIQMLSVYIMQYIFLFIM